MTTAICFKCGADKSGALTTCQHCGVVPRTKSQNAVSLALSIRISSVEELAQYSQILGRGGKASVPREALVRAMNAFKVPEIRAMLVLEGSQAPSAAPIKPPAADSANRQSAKAGSAANSQTGDEPAIERTRPKSASEAPVVTALDRSSFMLLGASTRDDRRRIVQLAVDKSLELAQDVCQKARSELTNPRARLGAELAWLPGVSPRKAHDLIDALHRDPMSTRSEDGLPILTQLNLEACAFASAGDAQDPADLANFIVEFAHLADDLDPDDVRRDVNEDRSISGFPEVKEIDQIEAELANRKRYFRNSVKHALEGLPTPTLIHVMTEAVDDATATGTEQAPTLIDDLVDSYGVETESFLNKEAESASALIQAALDAAPNGEHDVKPIIDKLSNVARNWDNVAQPIQLSARARGTNHEPSLKLGYAIRGLAIELYNKHDMLGEAQRLASLLQELFAEVPDLSDQLQQDSSALSRLAALESFRTLCSKTRRSIERYPDSAYDEGESLLTRGRALLAGLPADTDASVSNEAGDMIAQTLCECAVAYGNKTSAWMLCTHLLESALSLASNGDVRTRINDNLTIVRNNVASLGGMQPVREVPSLNTAWGIGCMLYGQADRRPSDGSYIATHYFTIFYIPTIPLARYRVSPINGGYRFLAKGGIQGGDIWRSIISIGAVIVGISILGSM